MRFCWMIGTYWKALKIYRKYTNRNIICPVSERLRVRVINSICFCRNENVVWVLDIYHTIRL